MERWSPEVHRWPQGRRDQATGQATLLLHKKTRAVFTKDHVQKVRASMLLRCGKGNLKDPNASTEVAAECSGTC